MASTNSLQTSITGHRWWGGFTAEITLTNSSTQDLENWSYSFDSPHLINTAPWGAAISAVLLDNGLTRYTLTGKDWGEQIPAGESVTIGFNGTQGTDLGHEGELSAEMLFAAATEVSATPQASEESAESSDTTPNPALEPVSEHGLGHHGMNHDSSSGDYIDINAWGSFHGSNHNSEHDELVGGRTAITTEAMLAYNGLRAFAGLDAVEIEAVGE